MEKISIITICYNSERTISQTLNSINNQKYKNYEHIIIDGGSSDNTLNIVNKANISNKIISENDKGIYDAFNKGLMNSNGEIIGFLNADDTFHNNDSLSKIIDAFEKNTECVFGDLIYTNFQDKIKRTWKGSPFKKGCFKKGWMPAHPTFYCRKKVYEKYGLYNDTYKIAGDFELMMRFLEKHNIQSKYISQTLVNMKTGGISNKSLKSKFKVLNEEFKAFKQNNIDINKISYIFQKTKKFKEFKFFRY